jgi:hypothetical protein
MTRRARSRFSAIAGGALRLVADSFFMRLTFAALRLWQATRPLSLLLIGLSLLCLLGAGLTARTVFLGLQPATDWLFWPVLAALLAFVVMLELCSASAMNAINGVLRLSYDLGRHRIATLLGLATIGALGLLVVTLWSGGDATPGIILPLGIALALAGLALWFERAYRRPAYPGFRDFHGDVVAARQHLARAAHAG